MKLFNESFQKSSLSTVIFSVDCYTTISGTSGGHHHRHLLQPEHQGSLKTTGTKVLLLLSVILLSNIKMNNLEYI